MDPMPEAPQAAVQPDPNEALKAELAKLINAVKSGASWFYWIAGLSLINTAMQFFESETAFVLGLGITQVADAIAATVAEPGTSAASVLRMVAIAFDLFAAGLFIFFGWQANQHKSWAFLTGMGLFLADTLLFLIVQDWLGLGFHALALFFIFGGYSALRKLNQELARLKLQGAAGGPVPEAVTGG